MSALTSGKLLARNTIVNLLGHGAPLLVALVSIPFLIAGLGTERFGALTLAWVFIGYFSLFDFGLGRALTQLVAERLGRGDRSEIAPLVWTALLAMVVLGVVGALLMAVLAPWLVGSLPGVTGPLRGESILAFHLLALSLPFVISTTGLRGVLEAHQRFGLVNALRVPMASLTYVAPLTVLPWTNSLPAVVGVLVAARVIGWAAHLAVCLATVPALRRQLAVRLSLLRPLARFGGWMTVSNLVSPLMVYLDRFAIASLLTVTAVAYYVTPYEVVSKLWLFPGAVLSVFFPAFATAYRQDPERFARLFDRALRVVFIGIFPVVLLVMAFAREGLGLWLGEEFARESTRVLQWLALGIFINSLAQVPFAALQGIGRPDITGKLHLLELPLYAAVLIFLTRRFGIEGAAIAWTLRVAVDGVVLFLVAGRLSGAVRALRRAAVLGGVSTVVLAASTQGPAGWRAALVGATLLLFWLLGRRFLLEAGEWRAIRASLPGGRSGEAASYPAATK